MAGPGIRRVFQTARLPRQDPSLWSLVKPSTTGPSLQDRWRTNKIDLPTTLRLATNPPPAPAGSVAGQLAHARGRTRQAPDRSSLRTTSGHPVKRAYGRP